MLFRSFSNTYVDKLQLDVNEERRISPGGSNEDGPSLATPILQCDHHAQCFLHYSCGTKKFVLSYGTVRFTRSRRSLLVLYFHLINIYGNFAITLAVGALVAIGVAFIVKPRLKASIQGEHIEQQQCAGVYPSRSR